MRVSANTAPDSRQNRAHGGRSRRGRAGAGVGMLCSLALGMTSTPANAQVPASQAVRAEQRASDQAFQQLIDEVMAVRLAGSWTVGDLLGVVPDADRSLRESLLVARRVGQASRSSGDLIEIEVSLPIEALAEMLQDIAARFFPKADRSVMEIESRHGRSIIGVGRVTDDGVGAASPVGWRQCDDRQLALVQAAAETDLRQHLLERVGQWRLTPGQTVGQLWGRFPAFRQAVGRRVRALVLPKPVFEPTGLCRLSSEIGRTDVLQILVRGAEDSGDAIEADLTRAVDPEFQDPLILDGFAVAPPPVAPTQAAAVEGESVTGRPGWIEGTLSVKIMGRPPANVADREARRRMAAGAAAIEAKRQLLLQIEQLPLPGGISVEGLLVHVGASAETVSAIAGAIQSAGAPTYDEQDNATITLTARLDMVWEIVRGIWPTRDAVRPPG